MFILCHTGLRAQDKKKRKGRVAIVCMCVPPTCTYVHITGLQGISPTVRIPWNEGEDGKKMGVFGE